MTALGLPEDELEAGRGCPDLLLPLIMRRVGLAEVERLTRHGDKWASRWADRVDPHHLQELRAICRAERQQLGSDHLAQAVALYLTAEEDDDDARPLLVEEDERELLRIEAEGMIARSRRPVQPARARQSSLQHLRLLVQIEQRRRDAWRIYMRDYVAATGLLSPWRVVLSVAVVLLVSVASYTGDIVPRRPGRRRGDGQVESLTGGAA